MDITTIIGILAIILNWTIALLGMPHQIYKLFKRKSSEGLSVVTFSLYVIAFGFGLTYGIAIQNMPLIIGNIPLVLFSAIIFGQVVFYKKSPRKDEAAGD